MYRRLLSLALILAVSRAPAADDLEFGLLISRHTLGLDYPGDVDTRYTQLRVQVIERSYRHVHGGFRLGISDLSQSGNPATDGLAVSGGSVGFILRGELPLGAGLSLYGAGSYDYHTVDGSSDEDEDEDEQRVRLDWFEGVARAGLSLRRSPLTFRAGPYYRHVDGDERARGSLDRTQALQAESATGVFADLRYQVDGSGWIALRLEQGSREGATLRFVRLFD